ncbi:MAG: CycL [Pseudomonadota bacterium]|jgi:cytochrome c-type biogenesis protein CcmH
MKRIIGLYLVLFLGFSGAALAVQPDEVLADKALEARARALSTELRCLVCQNQSIDDSNAPLARDLRLIVREKLVAGESEDAILAFLVARYGEFVLLKPRFTMATALLWLGPFLVLLAGGIGIVLVARRRRVAENSTPLSADEQARLDLLTRQGD